MLFALVCVNLPLLLLDIFLLAKAGFTPFLGPLQQPLNQFVADQWVESPERLIQHNQFRVIGRALANVAFIRIPRDKWRSLRFNGRSNCRMSSFSRA